MTTVLGKGKNISTDDLIHLGLQTTLSRRTILAIIEQTKSALAEWPILAKQYAVEKENVRLISASIT